MPKILSARYLPLDLPQPPFNEIITEIPSSRGQWRQMWKDARSRLNKEKREETENAVAEMLRCLTPRPMDSRRRRVLKQLWELRARQDVGTMTELDLTEDEENGNIYPKLQRDYTRSTNTLSREVELREKLGPDVGKDLRARRKKPAKKNWAGNEKLRFFEAHAAEWKEAQEMGSDRMFKFNNNGIMRLFDEKYGLDNSTSTADAMTVSEEEEACKRSERFSDVRSRIGAWYRANQ
ncbi:hypothetical protein C8R43DRAFT_1122457 [Mycena crocata]|nr:hypothetical protein C8R43DRAFT_1122457 [Mycena crocata]